MSDNLAICECGNNTYYVLRDKETSTVHVVCTKCKKQITMVIEQ